MWVSFSELQMEVNGQRQQPGEGFKFGQVNECGLREMILVFLVSDIAIAPSDAMFEDGRLEMRRKIEIVSGQLIEETLGREGIVSDQRAVDRLGRRLVVGQDDRIRGRIVGDEVDCAAPGHGFRVGRPMVSV